MKKLLAVLFFFVSSSVYSQEVVYGPFAGYKTGELSTRSALSTFKTGSSEYFVSRVAIGNTFRGSYDSLFIVEFGRNMQMVSQHFFFYTGYTLRRNYGTVNYFDTVSPVKLKPNTRYGVYWVSANPNQGWSFTNSPMRGISNTGIVFDRNYVLDYGLTGISKNLLLILYGVSE